MLFDNEILICKSMKTYFANFLITVHFHKHTCNSVISLDLAHIFMLG